MEEKLEPFHQLEENHSFWNCTGLGIAVFSAEGYFKVVGLHTPVEDIVIVAKSFHTKPLRHYLQSADRYHLLGLGLHDMKLYEGNRHGLTEVSLPAEVPPTTQAALVLETTNQNTLVATAAGMDDQEARKLANEMVVDDQIEMGEEKYFRIVSNGVYEYFSKPTKFKLIEYTI